MTELTKTLKSRISETGPISVAEYMHICLSDPTHGYYTNRDPFGPDGDFVTAPEVSQMFGEMLALWLIQAWVDQGRPEKFALVELGPGRGTLMADILRTAEAMPTFVEAAEVWLVETSPAMRRKQAATLIMETTPNWVNSVDDLPDLPIFVVANEFFDALPIHQFSPSDAGWRERMIDVIDGKLAFTLGRPSPNADLDEFFTGLPENLFAEVSYAAENVAAVLGDHIAKHGGVALVVDYGDWDGAGDTLQAVKNHDSVNELDHPHGEADVTAHVNFAAIARAAGAARTEGLAPQGTFLERIGINQRAQTLAGGADKKIVEEIGSAHHRLTHPEEMGTLFKVMAIVHKDAPHVPGFEDDVEAPE
ncbi:MAG: SAM-dependent methyltransferase [Paracoccaceae bacterium]|jgi:SAM-dependent MidA family methyltransferase